MLTGILNYIQTIKSLKSKQVFYRIYYRFKKNEGVKNGISSPISYPLSLKKSIASYTSYTGENTFSFLNISHDFKSEVDWNFKTYGMLWAYNLNYFEFLLQTNLEKDTGLRLINKYISQSDNIRVGVAPYPISLRNLFWIRFITEHSIQDKNIDSFIYQGYKILLSRLEYHLLGNHLLENAFSLLFGAYYFQDEEIYQKAYSLLKTELKEQILSDGAHFELSPMYHQTLLYRLLDCYNLVSNNNWKNDNLKPFLHEKASAMLSWLKTITYPSGNIPLLNDSASGIAPTSDQLYEYAKRLEIPTVNLNLSDSYYRIFSGQNYKCITDIGGITPSYQPGHAHADTFNIVLEINNQETLVDTGCSTYENNSIRHRERSTASHNTVTINGKNSSNVWASHRVGKRAKIEILEDKPDLIRAKHFGFGKLGIHTRTFTHKEGCIEITDKIEKGNTSEITAYFHLDYKENPKLEENIAKLNNCNIIFENASHIFIEDYEQAIAFNKRVKAKRIRITFSEYLKSQIIIFNSRASVSL